MTAAPKKPTASRAGDHFTTKTPAERRAYVTEWMLAAGYAAHQFDHWTDDDYAKAFRSMTSGVIHQAAMARLGDMQK